MSTLNFKLAKSTFLVNSDVSTPVAFFKSAFVVYLNKPNSTFTLTPKVLGSGKYSLIYTISFLSIQMLKELS